MIKVDNSKKHLVLGDMLELGKYSKKLHIEIGKSINKTSLKNVNVIGKYMSEAYKILHKNKKGSILKNNFEKVFSIENFEQSWNEVADILKVDREPRLNANRSNEDYKKYANMKNLSEEFISWHKDYNSYDYLLYQEFCT